MAVLFLLLIHFSAGEAHTMRALVGDDVILSVDTKTSSDIGEAIIDWSRTDLNPEIVHLHENRRTFYKHQNPAYRGRTMLSAEDLDKGIISLKLSRVRLADEGNYTCLFKSKDNKYTIQLLVGAASSPVITLEDVNSNSLVLGCRADGWYPQPKLSWWDTEGYILPAVTMDTTQDPDRLYHISSTVMVERKSQRRTFICRVHQELFNQTRETELHLPGIGPGAASSPVITLEDVNSNSLVLGCRADGWYPQPKLSWWDTEGHLLPAVTMNTTQDPDRLYHISSTVMVGRKSQRRTFICRVHQELFNQTRETELHLPENLFSDLCPSHRNDYGFMAASVAFLLVAFLFVAVVIYWFAYRKVHGNSQNRNDKDFVEE